MTTTEMGPSSSKRPRGRPRAFDRDAALVQAMSLFWRYGYEGTSISDLTEAMGITPPSLYAAFGSKEALYREVLERYGATRRTRITDIVESDSTAYQTIVRVLRDRAKDFTDPKWPAGCMISTATLKCAPENQGAANATSGKRAFALSVLVNLFEKAVQEGELPSNVDPEGLARFYGAIVQGMSVQAQDGASEEDLLKIVDQALQAWPGPGTLPL